MTSVPGAKGKPARVLLETCRGRAAQRWLASSVGQLKNAATGQCLAATRGGRVRQADAATARCTGVVYQRWTIPYAAAITP